MIKKAIGECTLCGDLVYENEKHLCKVKKIKESCEHYLKLSDNYFNKLMEAQRFIKENVWDINDKDKIKELLLIIWDCIANRELEIKILKGDNDE